jgi:UrcA family protein
MRTLITVIAVAAVLGAAGLAQAADRSIPREVSSERLEVGNVDFRDANQVRAFHKRLQHSAMFVCGVNLEASSARRAEDRACADKVMADTVQSLNRPLLTATYQQSGAPMVARGY